jgi:C4-dicarboxylate-specific signal transduction histidine kinase
MMTRHSITFKIALHLTLSSLFLIIVLALIDTNFIQRQFIRVEQEKLISLMEDALSTLGINLSYEFKAAVNETGNQLLSKENILFVEIKPITGNEKFTFAKKTATDLKHEFSKTMEITDPGTGKIIGTITVVYSRDRYRQMMNRYYRYQWLVLILYLIFVFFLIRSLVKKIRPLSSLAEQMQAFVPGKKVRLLKYQKGDDEISKIAEAANVMLQNISEYAGRLQQMNTKLKQSHDELEQRVAERTQELQEKQLQLAHAGRLASLGELAAGIAHELGQPLQIINTASEIIISEIEADTLNREEVLPIARKITAQVARSQIIINNMRTFARYNREKSAIPLDIRIPLKECLCFFNEQFYQHQIKLTVRVPDSPPMVRTDFQKFQQILVNLLSNARYAVDRKSVQLSKFTKQVAITLQCGDGDQIILEVRDNGIGMSQEEQQRCLEPFYTTKDPGEGTGLGLAIAYGIIKEFDFQLEIISHKEVGTTMRITMQAEPSSETSERQNTGIKV